MEKLLCLEPPAPSADILAQFPEVTEADFRPTARETMVELHQVGGCEGCHSVIDDFGFGFENYDHMGRFQTMDELIPGQPAPIDPSGSLSLDGKPQDYADATGLVQILADSEEVQRCMARQLLRFALQREEHARDVDACTLDAVAGKFGPDATLADAFLAFTQTDAFLNQAVGGNAEAQP